MFICSWSCFNAWLLELIHFCCNILFYNFALTGYHYITNIFGNMINNCCVEVVFRLVLFSNISI